MRSGLLGFNVSFVARFRRYKIAHRYAGISFNRNPLWIAVLKPWDRNARIQKARRTLMEHQSDGNTVMFLWGN